MSVLIIGSEGSQGKRYQAILKSLDVPFSTVDISDGETQHGIDRAVQVIEKASRFLIASPTETHEEWIRHLMRYGKPILCEKPICTNLNRLASLFHLLSGTKTRLSMVAQYRHLLDPDSQGESYYNYFRHGKDGLLWDCLQIIGFAKGPVEIREDSPIWQCQINGHPLSLSEMDEAYVDDIYEWMNRLVPSQSLVEIYQMHKKVDALCRRS